MKETKQTMIIELYREGMTVREIAEEIDSSINSVQATVYKFKLNKEEDRKIDKIYGIISRHLVGHYHPVENSFKAHYKITVENLIDFINTYFEVKQ